MVEVPFIQIGSPNQSVNRTPNIVFKSEFTFAWPGFGLEPLNFVMECVSATIPAPRTEESDKVTISLFRKSTAFMLTSKKSDTGNNG